LADTRRERLIEAAARLGVEPAQMPRHIAIIMDGNGRWAEQRGLPRFEGHRQGGKSVEKIVDHCVDIGLECLTLYSFSMQNWKRPAAEIDFLMHLYCRYLAEIRPLLMKRGIRLVHLGSRNRLSEMVLEAIDKTIELTKDNDVLNLSLALNYGSREEIIEVTRKIAESYKAGELSLEDIDEDCFSSQLYTSGLIDPDLLIRTSGEMRMSNFLLWQLSYAEFYATETLWPDFDGSDVDEAVVAYAKRSRRFGGLDTEKS